MDTSVRNQSILKKYIPEPAVPLIAEWIVHFNFKLKIRKPRQTRYGDYTQPKPGMNHLITINRDMNHYAFLLTLVHEIAHLLTFEKYGNRVKPHGSEWKNSFKELMRPMMRFDIFPEDVRLAIISYMKDPGASSCSDQNLLRILKKYDPDKGLVHLETLHHHAHFEYGGRVFIKGAKMRTRYQCKLRDSHQVYLFAGLADVKVATT